MDILNRIQVKIYDFFYNITGVVLAVILITVTLGIVSRYIFNDPFMWTEELCTILMVYLAYFSAPMATISQEHVVADFFKNLLPQKWSKPLAFIIRIFEIAFFVILARSCILFMPSRTYRTTALRLHRNIYFIPVLIGTVCMIYSLCVHVLNDLFPGFDYYKKRREQKDQEIKRLEQAEEQELVTSMDSFMDEINQSEKGEKQ